MFWSKKKSDKGLPDLPNRPKAAPSMRDFHHVIPSSPRNQETEEEKDDLLDSDEEIHNLPSFPDSPMKKGFNQIAIKDAVKTDEIKDDLPKMLDFPREESEREIHSMHKSRIIEMEEWQPHPKHKKPRDLNLPEEVHMRMHEHPEHHEHDKHGPIFVRLDRFEEARDSLALIKEKLKDIEELLHTIREVKTKEDQELSSWEKEMQAVKDRVNAITTDIFEKAYKY